jgi:prepilin-type N-terminal cleavage/methylation domain-containing protein
MGIPRRSRPTQAGFTLVELVLTVTLILLLAGAAVLNFGSFQRGAQLDEGLGQLEYLFRLARASAASSGRRVQITFGGETQTPTTNASPTAEGIQVRWEPDPLIAPGTFHPLAEAAPLVERLNELIQIRPLPFPESAPTFNASEDFPSDLSQLQPPSDAGVSTNVPALRFYPDGSSDPADFLVASLDPEDGRLVRVRLSGLVGTVRRQWLSPDEVAGTLNGPAADNSGSVSSPSGAAPGAVSGTPRSP